MDANVLAKSVLAAVLPKGFQGGDLLIISLVRLGIMPSFWAGIGPYAITIVLEGENFSVCSVSSASGSKSAPVCTKNM